MKQRFSKRTRLVSALLTLAMVFTFLPFSAFAATDSYGPVYISDLTFPDETFLNYVKWFDKDKNGTLSPEERYAVTEIYVSGKKITSLKGIEFFPNLKKLYCADNNLTSLDVSQNTALEHLDCDNNQLTSLQADNCNLKTYNCDGNEYSVQVYESTRILDPGTLPGNFDISRVKNMTGATKNADGTMTVNPGGGKVLYEYRLFRDYDYCCVIFTLNVEFIPDGTVTPPSGGGDSIAIDASNFPDPEFRAYVKEKLDTDKNNSLSESERNAVTEIDVSNKNITTLEGISYFPNLFYLDCKKNQLTELDVSKNPALWGLECDENQLTSLDVSQNAELVYLYCNSNNLTSLDVSQTAVTTLYTSGNQIDINVEKTPRTFDLSTLPGFNASKASGWVGGDVDGNTLKVKPGVTQVTYTYDCGKGLSETFTLNVNVVPDGSTGGGTTPGGSTGGGSTGGGSTGGSTGGGSTGGGSTISPEAGKYQLTVTDGVATVNGSKGAVLNVEPGATVTLTADTTKFPDIDEFGWWEISPYGSVSDTLTGQYQRTATFMMPNENVTARAMSKTAGVSTGGDGGGGGAAILLVGGAAAAGLVGYGVYSYVSEQQLKALLPEGVAMPENRAQTALLLWNTAGRPEPAAQPAFPDVADPDTAKAAQWCVEHGLMNAKFRGRFAPDGSSPAYKTLNAYRQLVG